MTLRYVIRYAYNVEFGRQSKSTSYKKRQQNGDTPGSGLEPMTLRLKV